MMEHGASARFENEDEIHAPVSIAHGECLHRYSLVVSTRPSVCFKWLHSSRLMASVFPACVEGGTVYAAGSAMRSSVACEQCFCLGAARRCVRPQCLPPPPACKPRPSAGACCPQRYYCEHRTTKPPEDKHPHGKTYFYF